MFLRVFVLLVSLFVIKAKIAKTLDQNIYILCIDSVVPKRNRNEHIPQKRTIESQLLLFHTDTSTLLHSVSVKQ